MATYSPSQLGIKAPTGGFQQGGWYSGRQFWGGSLSDPGTIHPQSNQQGAGQAVSKEVNAQSAANQGLTSQQLEAYLAGERARQQAAGVTGQPGAPSSPGASSASAYQPRTFSPEEEAMMRQAKGQYNQPSINLPELYQSLYNDSGVNAIKDQLSIKEKAYNEAVSGINDNPYYSEATRVGRIAKLEDRYQRDTQALRNDIAMKTADIETQINLQSKQFDIESQQAQQARDQFNTLLQLGALDDATGEDIAAIVRTTGISSSMILSAINSKRKNDVQTSTISFDDGENQGFAVINSQTGEIINRQVVGTSSSAVDFQRQLQLQEIKSADEKSGGGGGGLTPTQGRAITSAARTAIIDQDGNKDKLLSQAEYENAVRTIMIDSGVDFATADNYATAAFNDLGYKKWRW